MNRRGFLTGILALGAAPAIVRADSLMRIVSRSDEDVLRSYSQRLYIDQRSVARGIVSTLVDEQAQMNRAMSALIAHAWRLEQPRFEESLKNHLLLGTPRRSDSGLVLLDALE